MLEVVYCEESIFDLPPPTLFIRGNNKGYAKLKILIEEMIQDGIEICLNDYAFINVNGTIRKIIFRPFAGQVTLKITNSEIITDLSNKDWQSLLNNISIILKSRDSLTYFIEFENYLEEGNLIIES